MQHPGFISKELKLAISQDFNKEKTSRDCYMISKKRPKGNKEFFLDLCKDFFFGPLHFDFIYFDYLSISFLNIAARQRAEQILSATSAQFQFKDMPPLYETNSGRRKSGTVFGEKTKLEEIKTCHLN